jgi:hypothetical protein
MGFGVGADPGRTIKKGWRVERSSPGGTPDIKKESDAFDQLFPEGIPWLSEACRLVTPVFDLAEDRRIGAVIGVIGVAVVRSGFGGLRMIADASTVHRVPRKENRSKVS